MRYKTLTILLVAFSLLPLVLAIDTEINVKTIPHHEVQITIINDASTILETFKGESDDYGDISFVYSSDRNDFNLITCLKKDGEKILPIEKLMENYPTGKTLNLELAPSWFEIIETPKNDTTPEIYVNSTYNLTFESNESLNESTILNQNETSLTSDLINQFRKITGFASSENEKGASLKVVYSVGAIILVLVIFFILIRVYRRKRLLKRKEVKEVVEEGEEDIKQAEEELRLAKEKVDKLKNKNKSKIDEIKKKLVEDEKELLRLRQEEKNK